MDKPTYGISPAMDAIPFMDLENERAKYILRLEEANALMMDMLEMVARDAEGVKSGRIEEKPYDILMSIGNCCELWVRKAKDLT